KGALNLSNVTILPSSGIGVLTTVGAADDGVIYAANQINATSSGFKIYRWDTADTNNPAFGQPPLVAFSNVITSPSERMAQTMAVRGAGTNTEILCAASGVGGQGQTNLYLFTTADGTNFTSHRIF